VQFQGNVDGSAWLNYALQAEQMLMTKGQKGFAITLGLVITLFSGQFGYGQQRTCTGAEARRAEAEAVTLRAWDGLYRSYKLYRQCDDGAIAEGYSESVARILVDHWDTLPQLARLAKEDAEFRRFVMGHVDATLNTDDIAKIRTHAKTKCPAGLRAICTDLATLTR
jgi:hypothetical protein